MNIKGTINGVRSYNTKDGLFADAKIRFKLSDQEDGTLEELAKIQQVAINADINKVQGDLNI